jgi:Flp pilus assembly protein TadG
MLSAFSSRFHALRSDQRGSTTLEFSLVALAFLMLLLGVMEFGRFFFLQHNVKTLTAEAARQALIQTGASGVNGGCGGLTTNLADVKSKAIQKTPFLTVAGANAFTITCSVNGDGQFVVNVSVSYTFSAIAPFLTFLSRNITDSTRLIYAPIHA